MDAQADARVEVAQACRVLAGADQGDLVWGHVSRRDPGGVGVWMKAASWGFDEVSAREVVRSDRDGAVLEGVGRRHAEYPIHTEILAARPDMKAVVHTHAPHAVAFASLGVPLRPLSHEGTLFVPPDIARFTETGDLILTAELGQAVAAALGPRNALLLAHHGIVTVGPDVPTATVTAVLLDRACRMNLLALAAGGPATWSSDDEALAKRDHCYNADLLRQAWDYLVRRAD